MAFPRTVPGLLVEALRRRRDEGAGPCTILVCDNLPSNGETVARIIGRYAELRHPELRDYIANETAFPSTMVDRIVPATTEADRAAITALGYRDAWPVVAEPFSQWVIEDRFVAGRPRWEEAGAQMVADVRPFELMKLRALNGAHSALAYIGSVAGLETVADAMADPELPGFLRVLWDRDLLPTIPERARHGSGVLHRAVGRTVPQSVHAPPPLADCDGWLPEAAATPAAAGAGPAAARGDAGAPSLLSSRHGCGSCSVRTSAAARTR